MIINHEIKKAVVVIVNEAQKLRIHVGNGCGDRIRHRARGVPKVGAHSEESSIVPEDHDFVGSVHNEVVVSVSVEVGARSQTARGHCRCPAMGGSQSASGRAWGPQQTSPGPSACRYV